MSKNLFRDIFLYLRSTQKLRKSVSLIYNTIVIAIFVLNTNQNHIKELKYLKIQYRFLSIHFIKTTITKQYF